MNIRKVTSHILPLVFTTALVNSCTHVFEREKPLSTNEIKEMSESLALLNSSLNKKSNFKVYETIEKAEQITARKKAVAEIVVIKTIKKKNEKVEPLKISEKLESIELKTKEIVSHNGFKNEAKNRIDFDKLISQIPNDKEEATIIADSISIKESSVVKSENKVDEADDLKVFDYQTEIPEKESIVADKNIIEEQDEAYEVPEELRFNKLSPKEEINSYAKAELSSSVLSVIKRELNKDVALKNRKREIVDEVSTKSAVTKVAPKNEEAFDYKNAFAKTDALEKTNFYITAREILPGSKTQDVFGFEFIPHYDRNDRVSDLNGEINLEYSTVGLSNVVAGLVIKPGYVDIQTDLDLSSESLKTVIPLIEAENFEKFLNTHKLNQNGSFVLVNLTKGAVDIELDSKISEKMYLTQSFKKTTLEEKPTFLLVTGVNPGNSFAKIKHGNNWYQKIINTQENMITYIDENSVESETQNFDLFTETRSGKVTEYSVNDDSIKLFASKNKVKKLAINKVQLKSEFQMSTQKGYLETTSGSRTFLGISGDLQEILIPAEHEKQTIMKEFKVSDLENNCIVQVNTQEDMKNFKASGPSDVGEVYTDIIYSDREGNLSIEMSEWTNKAYILGDRTGILNIQIEYSNGTKRIFNSYCSNDSYIVENY